MSLSGTHKKKNPRW